MAEEEFIISVEYPNHHSENFFENVYKYVHKKNLPPVIYDPQKTSASYTLLCVITKSILGYPDYFVKLNQYNYSL
jgi:ABC-type antimicrobial peptide transport system permease subunit